MQQHTAVEIGDPFVTPVRVIISRITQVQFKKQVLVEVLEARPARTTHHFDRRTRQTARNTRILHRADACQNLLGHLLIFGKHDKHILLIHVQPAFDQRAAPTLRIGDFTGRRRQQGVDFTQHFRIVIRCGRYDHHVIRR